MRQVGKSSLLHKCASGRAYVNLDDLTTRARASGPDHPLLRRTARERAPVPSQAARTLRRRRRGVLSPLPLPPAPTPCAPVRHRRARWRTHLHHNHRDHRGIGARVCAGSPTMTGQCEKSTQRSIRTKPRNPLRNYVGYNTALVPRPRAHLTRYHGVFAPNFKHRRRIVPKPAHQTAREPHASRPAPMSWMQRLNRTSSTSTSNTVACVATRCASSRASKRPNSSRRSSPISPPATPTASTAPAHRRSIPRKPNPRPPHLRPCPDCARGCTTAPLRLASRALRPPPPS